MIYEINPDTVVYETDVYAIDVGMFPGEELKCYRAWNKDTTVLEYAHSVLFYIQQWADSATKVIKEGAPEELDLPDITGVGEA